MSQFVNNWNGQNGMGVQQQTPIGSMNPMGMPMQNQMGQQMPMPQNAPMMQPNNAGWKTYSPPPQPQIRPTNGRWVESFEEIKPQEIPMDGSMSIFPQQDYSCIYVKYWDNNGNLMSYRFLPEKNDPPMQQQFSMPAEMNDILKGYEAISTQVADRLDSVDKRLERLDDILAAIQTKPNARRSNTNDKDREEK